MTLDPSYGALLCVPLLILAVAAVIIAHPERRAAALIAACGIFAFVIGCGGRKDTVDSTSTAPASYASPEPIVTPVAPPVAGARMTTIAPSELYAARHANPSGLVSEDVLDTRADGSHQSVVRIDRGSTLHVIGWAYHEPRGAPCGGIGLVVDGARVYPGRYGYSRPDVAAFYKDPSRSNLGYSIEVPAAQLGRGLHTATIVCIVPGGAATRYPDTLRITVH